MGEFGQVGKERSGILVPGVGVIPERRNRKLVEPGGDQGRLAGAGRTADPEDGPVAVRFQQFEQAHPLQRAVQPRPREFRE